MKEQKCCVYCGDWYQCRDHVIPISYSSSYRNYKPKDIVKCCMLCNSLAGDSLHFSIMSKAKYLYHRYNRKYKKVLNYPVWDIVELNDLDYGLRQFIVSRQHLKRLITFKLENLELVACGLAPRILNKFKSHEEALSAL